MSIQFLIWTAYFLVSFACEKIGWMEQGKAFLYINLFVSTFCTVKLIYKDTTTSSLKKKLEPLRNYMIFIIIFLLITWVIAKLFSVDYFVTFQIITFARSIDLANDSDKE